MALVVCVALPMLGCGDDPDEAAEATTTTATTAGRCPSPAVPSTWLASYCTALAAPGQIVAQQLVPAITGEHAEPPSGEGWDWAALAAGCDAMTTALQTLTGVVAGAPTAQAAIADKTDGYVDTLRRFTTECGTAAERADAEELKALVPLLDEAAQIATELEAMAGDLTEPT